MGGSCNMAENEAMRKDCGNCFSCLFPAALVSSDLSVHVNWASHSHLRLPWGGTLLSFLVTGEVLAPQEAPLFLVRMSFIILEEVVEEHGYKNEVILINALFICSGFTVLPAPVSWGLGLQASGTSFWPDIFSLFIYVFTYYLIIFETVSL